MIENMSYTKCSSDIPLSSATFGDLINEARVKHKNKAFLISKTLNNSFTFEDVIEQADNLALGLFQLGLKPGDKVGIIVKNSIEAFVVNLACARGGFISVNLCPALQPRELEYCINKIKIACVISVEKYKMFSILDILKDIIPEIDSAENGFIDSKNVPSLKTIVLISENNVKGTFNYENVKSSGKLLPLDVINNIQSQINCHDTYTVVYTSGTTGNPKAVGLTHYQMYNSNYCVYLHMGLEDEENKFCFYLPLFHVLGQVFLYFSLISGSPLVLPSDYYNSTENLKTISEEKCTFLMGSPTMFADLIKIQKEQNLPLSARKVMTGSALCSDKLLTGIKDILHIKNIGIVYGCSETVAVTMIMVKDNEMPTPGLIGDCLEHIEIKVVNNNGNTVPIGTIGDMCVRGYSVTTGYLENPNTNEFGKDGWYKTGDAVFLDKDKRVYIAGRVKEIINRGGEKISPTEVEGILESHSSIVEAGVVGTFHERLGEDVCACLRLTPNTSITLEQVKDFCTGKLSYYKIPSQIVIVDSLPKTSLGKLQRLKLLQSINKDCAALNN